jgi:tetratricopeptide (TPR) repeat protein
MRVLPCRILSVLLAVLFSATSAWAETITLKSGKVVEGKIVDRDSRSIQLDVGLDFPITYYLDEIKTISEAPSKPAAAPSVSGSTLAASDEQAHKADDIEQQGLGLIDDGHMDQGVKLLREAIKIDPQANRYLNLGSILFGNGVALQKQGQSDEAAQTFKEAEDQLQQAIKRFDPNGETTFLSEAYNLLGAIYANGFNDKTKAKAFYEKSLSFYDNPEAKRGLAALK